MRSQRSDRGQSLLLLPAGFLIVLLLGSLVLEAAALHLRQRQLDDLADSIANDAAAVGFDIDAFRASGEIRIDPALARSVIGPAIAISALPTASLESFSVVDDPSPIVEIGLTVEHERIIGGALLGGAPSSLSAVGRAELVPSEP